MNFSIIYAFDQTVFGEEAKMEKIDKKAAEKQRFTVEEYQEDKMKGYKFTKKIKNIDAVSSEKDINYNLSGILDEKSDNKYIFKVKKGLLKNIYTAKFEFNASDSSINNTTDMSNNNSPLPTDNTSLDNIDMSNLAGNLDLSFNVNVPCAAKKNNATSVNNNNKDLKWNLSAQNTEIIEFEFELYNMTFIYIGIAFISLAVIAIVFIIINNKGRKLGNGNKNIGREIMTDRSITTPQPSNANIINQSISKEAPAPSNSYGREMTNNVNNDIAIPELPAQPKFFNSLPEKENQNENSPSEMGGLGNNNPFTQPIFVTNNVESTTNGTLNQDPANSINENISQMNGIPNQNASIPSQESTNVNSASSEINNVSNNNTGN